MERKTDTGEQRILKRLYKVQGWFSRLALNILYFGTLVCLVGAIYYGFCGLRGLERVLKFIPAICTPHFAVYLAQIQVT